MTARNRDRARPPKILGTIDLILAAGVGNVAYLGAAAAFDGNGKVVPVTSAPHLHPIGLFASKKTDATLADKSVSVDLGREVRAYWWANSAGGDAVLASDVGKLCFFADDDTVTITPTNRSGAGRVWAVDAAKGVLVEQLTSAGRGLLSVPTPIAFVANDYVLTAAALVQDSVVDVPATGAASTVTLPAGAPNGSRVTFSADGTKNAHTVQYRDATGPVNLTTALTAAKRHLVICVKQNGIWCANAYVSP